MCAPRRWSACATSATTGRTPGAASSAAASASLTPITARSAQFRRRIETGAQRSSTLGQQRRTCSMKGRSTASRRDDTTAQRLDCSAAAHWSGSSHGLSGCCDAGSQVDMRRVIAQHPRWRSMLRMICHPCACHRQTFSVQPTWLYC